jgi:peptide-methionine (R)-S-oxide reductase
MTKIQKTEEEWKKVLTPQQYEVLRNKGTEPKGGAYFENNDKGMYLCAACGHELFSSDSKFELDRNDPNFGWPSFDQALPGAVHFEKDSKYGMERTEVLCATCGSHLGHVFDDGPKETTGKRFCINGACLILNKN